MPGSSKLNLVENATSDSAANLDKFTNALRDGGYLPMTFAVKDLAFRARGLGVVPADRRGR